MVFFSVTWRIENFSMCPHKTGECFKSPMFKLPEPPELRNTEWNFWLYPRGNSTLNSNQVSFYIERKDPDQSSEVIDTFFVVLSIVSFNSDSNHLTYRHFLEMARNKTTGYPQFIPREDVNDPDEGYLCNDTLTIHMFIYPERFDGRRGVAPDARNIFPSDPSHSNYTAEKCFSKDGDAKDMPLNHCSFLTRIPVERKRLNWTIRELTAMRQSGRELLTAVLDSELREGARLQLDVNVEGERLKIGISRRGTRFFSRSFVKCEASFTEASGFVRGSKKLEIFFGNTYQRRSFTLINRLGTDSLELIVDLTISYEPHQNVDSTIACDQNVDSSLRKEIRDMLNHEESFDASFECRNENQFPVHRFLLLAKSPVFRAMFSRDTLETRSGVVRMLDTETETVRQLRDYLYTDSIAHLDTHDVLQLYAVADKYQIEKLKDRCVGFLKLNMDLRNVCEILIKADMHQDRGLKDYATDFVIAEVDFDSDLWKAFMEENLQLAAEAMRQCCLRDTRNRKGKFEVSELCKVFSRII